jgi:predicted regulator of Ras-like GTPase activity (Roadblock/LC7/MglB family)
MGLKGTLADLGIVDLIQFPNAGRKTGEMTVTGKTGEAKLYYEKGTLVHAVLGDQTGMEALVFLVDWTEGSFEFNPDVAADMRTIQVDLHRAVMQALKLHDERKLEEEQKRAGQSSAPQENSRLGETLEDFLKSNDFAVHAAVLSSEGASVATAAVPGGPPEEVERLYSTMYELTKSYPRENLGRIIIEDAKGTVVMVSLSDGGFLVVIAKKEASLGAVSMGTGKLAARL